mmetsp:Transcript_85500/g.242060  ORF Transcript_85500/g.242060 Transcript_85500/m.242060 type:complete len:274 (+) Transcript_85500:1116-1937(+)
MHVSLLDVDLGACNATDAVSVAVVVRARRGILVLPHRGQVQGRVAPTLSAREVNGVPKRPAEQVERHVVLVAVVPRRAAHRKVGPGAHVGGDRAVIGNLHWHGAVLRAPSGRHDLRGEVRQTVGLDLHHAGTRRLRSRAAGSGALRGRAGGAALRGTAGGGAALRGRAGGGAALRGRTGGGLGSDARVAGASGPRIFCVACECVAARRGVAPPSRAAAVLAGILGLAAVAVPLGPGACEAGAAEATAAVLRRGETAEAGGGGLHCASRFAAVD